MPHPADVEPRLAEHLAMRLGAWPPSSPLDVVANPDRDTPEWDGALRAIVGVGTPDGAVLSVSPRLVDPLRRLIDEHGPDLEAIRPHVPAALGEPGGVFGGGVFRWSTAPTGPDPDDGPDGPGVWLPRDDPRVLPWLKPFNGDVLVSLVDDEVAAGVGRKQHDAAGHEIAVVTEEGHRGQGWARRLVTQAARRILDDGAVPLYFHAEANEASARTADACGFPDVGWRILGLFGGRASADP